MFCSGSVLAALSASVLLHMRIVLASRYVEFSQPVPDNPRPTHRPSWLTVPPALGDCVRPMLTAIMCLLPSSG